ncbi:MAG: hypothetical protein IH944_00905 [Armatimonadetes bacterium]|nr:hypothetical protein [Armatimonadota bacterium]
MLLALAVTLLLGNQGNVSDESVTFHGHAKRVSVLLAELGEQIGQELLADKRAGDLVLFLAVKDVKAEDLLVQIAWATYSDWVENDDGSQTLTYSEQKVERRSDELASELRTRVEAWSEAAYKGQPEEFTADEAIELAFWLQSLSHRERMTAKQSSVGAAARFPAHRLLKRLLPLIDYAKVVLTGEQTFSTFPDLWSLQLPESAAAPLDDYKREIAMLATALEPYGLSVMGLPLDSRENRVVTFDSPERVDLRVSEQRVAISIYGPLGTGSIDIGYLSSHGENSATRNPYESDWMRRLPVGLRIEFSSATQALVKMRRKLAINQEQTDRQMVLRPIKRDPLSFVASDALGAIGKVLARNVVAVLMDEQRLLWAPSTSGNSVAIGWLLEGLNQHQSHFDDDWITFRMPNPRTDRKRQMDRAELGLALRNTVRDGRFMIDDLLAFWPADSDSAHFEAYYQGVAMLMPPTTERVLHNSIDFLSFLASLTPGELRATTGSGLTVSQLSPAARAAFRKLQFLNGVPYLEVLGMFYTGVPDSALLKITFERAEPHAILEALPEETGKGWYYNFFSAKTLSYDRRYLFRNNVGFTLVLETNAGSAYRVFGFGENGFGLTPTHYDDLPDHLQQWFKESSEVQRKKRGGR